MRGARLAGAGRLAGSQAVLAGLQGARLTEAGHLLGEGQPRLLVSPTGLLLWALISLSASQRRGRRGALPTLLTGPARACPCSLRPRRARGGLRPWSREPAAGAGSLGGGQLLGSPRPCRTSAQAPWPWPLPTPLSPWLWQATDTRHRDRDPLLVPSPTSILIASCAFYHLIFAIILNSAV